MPELDAWCAPLLRGEPPPLVETGTRRLAPGRAPGLVLRVPRWKGPEVEALARDLREARAALLERPAREIAGVLGRVGARFLDPGDAVRRRALELLPAEAGLSPAMARTVLDGMAADWTADRLEALLEAEFDDPRVLDGFTERPGRPGRAPRGAVRAVGAPLAVHVCSGSVAGVSTTSLVRSLLVKSAVLLKPGRGDIVLPVLFLEALLDADPELASAAAVLYWPGGEGAAGDAALAADADAAPAPAADVGSAAGDAALAAADLVVAYGSDASVASVRRKLPAHVPLVRYHHRASVAVVGREALAGDALERVARETARAVALFDQRGCVSPQMVWVEKGGARPPQAFAEALAAALEHIESELPSGPLADGEASALQQLRGAAELRGAAGEDVAVWHGGRPPRPGSAQEVAPPGPASAQEPGRPRPPDAQEPGPPAPWTVVYEDAEEGSAGGGPGRFVRVRPVDDALTLGRGALSPLRHHLQTVAVAGMGVRRAELAEVLARVGALRVTTPERAPWPPPWWHHDGGGPLRALVRWVDLEG